MGAYNATYEHFVQPTQGEQSWNRTKYDKPVPPPIKKAAGRPKKQRRKHANEGSIQNNKLKRSNPECICSRCGHPNHNIRNYMNFGVPPKPRGWKPGEATEVPAASTNPTATTKNENEPQFEIDELPRNPSQAIVSTPLTQTTRLAPMGQGQPDINFINPPYRPPGPISAVTPNYNGITRKKFPTKGGLLVRPHAGFTGPSASSPTTLRSTRTPGPTSTTGPIHGPSASSGPIFVARPFQEANASSGPISVARPFQGVTSSSPTTVRPSGTLGPTSAARPF
ncbi:hypothetical protein SESBI_20568 [Sesbania bispinosa]|nr:hypothetical protein SESBI_20568 [Sesbania bispinosa]